MSRLTSLVACIALVAPASAQEGEIILDPELAGTAPAAAPAQQGDDVILDPELSGTSPPPGPSLGAPSAQRTDLRVVLRSRLALDLSWDDPREDVWEATQLALFEARVRRSERLSFTLGVRAQHFFAARQDDTRDARAERFELDAAPTALHADIGLSDNVSTRIGYQGVHLGRFDALGASDVLSRYDLRAGMSVMPEQSEIAQPAVSADWDIVQGVALRGIYVPFFAPHRVNAFEGDYALLPQTQASIDEGLRWLAFDDENVSSADIAAAWRAALSRSGQARFFESGFAAFAPDPSLANPQAALRLTAHGPSGELGLTAASALEHLPMGKTDALGLPTVHYGRFGLLALDAATEIGPVLAGIELAYTSDRGLMASDASDVTGTRTAESDIAHAALRGELVHGDRWVAALEASAAYMLADPGEGERWLFTVERRFQLAVVGFVAHAVPSAGLTLELAGGFVAGPTYVIAPRVELRLWEQLYAEVGAAIVGGRGPRNAASNSATLGSLYDDTDQAFVGLRWVL